MSTQMINLVSDTVTKPTPGMLEAMMQAPVGDDVFGQDPSVNALEEKVAGMFGHESAVFCPSGTMTNQIALKVHTQPLDEVICDHYSHIYQYESAGFAFNSGISVNLIARENGKITADRWSRRLSLFTIGCRVPVWSYWKTLAIREVVATIPSMKLNPLPRAVCQQNDLRLHLDGARLFNALVETGRRPTGAWAQLIRFRVAVPVRRDWAPRWDRY